MDSKPRSMLCGKQIDLLDKDLTFQNLVFFFHSILFIFFIIYYFFIFSFGFIIIIIITALGGAAASLLPARRCMIYKSIVDHNR